MGCVGLRWSGVVYLSVELNWVFVRGNRVRLYGEGRWFVRADRLVEE